MTITVTLLYLFVFDFFSYSDRNPSAGTDKSEEYLGENTHQSVICGHHTYREKWRPFTGEHKDSKMRIAAPSSVTLAVRTRIHT